MRCASRPGADAPGYVLTPSSGARDRAPDGLSPSRLPGALGPEDLGAGHVLAQRRLVEEVTRGGLGLAEELLRLVVSVAALLVVALAQRDDREGLGGVGHDDDLGRGLPALADHRLAVGRWRKA